MPSVTKAKKCDTLSFINHSSGTLKFVFGDGTNSTGYAGETSYSIMAGQSQTISLSESGTYTFHDQSKPATAGSFTVGE